MTHASRPPSPITSHVWVCLCHPSDVRNVAGAIRAVANFGLAGVKLITGSSELTDPDALHKLSSGASAVVTVEVFKTLDAALYDATIVIGTTRRQRAHDHLRGLWSHELSIAIHDHERPHVLFGNERVGLSHAELDLCHAVVELHSRPSFPSLNLAHAVACVAYELARPIEYPQLEVEEIALGAGSSQAQSRPSSAQPSAQLNVHPLPTPMTFAREDEAFLRRVMEVSERVSYPPGRSPERPGG